MPILACKVTDMDSRAAAARVGTRVSKAIQEAGVDPTTIAEATGLTSIELEACLAGTTEFSIPQLVRVGGLLGVRTVSLVGDAA